MTIDQGTARAELGVIGGSGLYALLDEVAEVRVDTPYGSPSDALFVGEVAGRRVAFLPRHGRLVTDHDAGVEAGDGVTHAEVLEVFAGNVDRLRTVLFKALGRLPAERDCGCSHALDGVATGLPGVGAGLPGVAAG
ncbi:nucleoside phosphorylase-I family protein [Kitasatospora aureofaciens]|uniref:hypothetical protein n=1 Tax=Kitasatospora aureofaciens TaxID=1894 RepID=UPI0036F499B4